MIGKLGCTLSNSFINGLLLRIYISLYTNYFKFSPNISIKSGLINLNTNFQLDHNPNEYGIIKSKITTLLSTISGKILILIDNLDRLDIEELLQILKLVRICSDFPKMIFILSFDKEQVENILSNCNNIDSEFLSKIVQIDINLPEIDSLQIDVFFDSAFKRIINTNNINLDNNFYEKFVPIYQNYLKPQLNNLRNVKRYLNAISFSIPLVIGEVNYIDFFTIEFIRVFFPAVYSKILNYKEPLLDFDTFIYGGNETKRKNRSTMFLEFNKIIEYKYGPNDKYIKGIIGSIFPTYGAFLDNPSNPQYFSSDIFQDSDRELQISSKKHFDKYFRLQILSREISNTYVQKLIEQLNNYDLNEESIQSEFFTLQENSLLSEFLHRLYLYKEKLSSIGIKSLLLNICLFAPLLKRSYSEFLILSENQNALILTKSIFTETEDEKVFLELFNKYILRCKSLSFISDLSLSLVSSITKNEVHVSSSLVLKQITSSVSKKIQKEVISSNLDILSEYPNSFISILRIIQDKNFLHSSEKAESIIYRSLKNKPKNIISFLGVYAVYNANNEIDSMNFPEISKSYNIDTIYDIVKNINENDFNNREENLLFSEFIHNYKNNKKT